MLYTIIRQRYVTDVIEIEADTADEAIDEANEKDDTDWKVMEVEETTFDINEEK